MLIDEFLSDYDFEEKHSIAIRADAATVYKAAQNANFGESWIVRMLLTLRGMSADALTLRNLSYSKFRILGERPSKELLIGLAGRFWTPWGDLQDVNPENFKAFNKGGYAKAVWNFSIDTDGSRSDVTRLTTETRIKCLDEGSRRSFGFYWTFVQPFSGLIRMEMLKTIKRGAETGTMKKLIFVAMLAVLNAGSVSAQITAIRAGKVVDPETGKVSINQVILVDGPNIKAIGAEAQIPPDATVIDLSKYTVMPGMMDAHSHLCMNVQFRRDAGRYYYTTLNDSNAKRAIQGAVNARSMLDYGFTAVRDVGNEGNYACVEVRRMIDSGEIDGPLFITAGRIIAPYGGQFHLQPDKKDLGEPEYFYADTRDEMRKAIRQNIHYGATVIKLVIDDQTYIYSVDDIKFAVEEAHAAGMKLAAHAWTAQGALNAAKAGVDSIEHGVAITDEALAIAKKNGIPVVPIPFTETEATLGGDPAGNITTNERLFIDPVKRAYKAGVTLVWGPDVTYNTKEWPRGKVSIGTLDEWKKAGLPPLVILQALTTNAAKLLGIEQSRGAIKPGMRADIIAVRGNPLENIETVKDVVFVMRNGKVYKQK
jgi:imidazolonepropionase-like amidohydrolase